MSKLSLFFIGIFIILLVVIYYPWFVNANIIGGDWPYFFDETIRALSLFPPSWSSLHGNRVGGIIPSYFLDQYLYFTAFLSSHVLHISWEVGYKALWFGTFLALSVFSSMFLVKAVFFQAKLWQMTLAALIFTTNTYILMVVGGGQMGIALAYAIVPLVLARFLIIVQSSKFKVQSSLVAGLVLAIQVMFDPRITFITMIAIVLFGLINIKNFRKEKSLILFAFVIPGVIAVLLHASWIAPLILFRHNPIEDLGSAIPTVAGLRFFSFASFSQTLSFLHPNWPENIFGKTYFMKPEFLLLPILAFSSLLFLNKSKVKSQKSKVQLKIQKYNNNLTIEQLNNERIIFFVLLGLVGAFLAKGANPPFGEINIWMFEYIPGFAMFRDPTKFYLLTALAYSVLIPFSVYSIYSWTSSKLKTRNSKLESQNYLPFLFLLFTISYLIFLMRPALFGRLGGTFKQHDVPKEYVELKDFLNGQHQFFRTLWIPRQQRFTFVSNTHPAIEAMPLFEAKNSSQIVSRLQGSESQRLLEELSVKYVIIPYDSIGEIFLRDRKYDEKQRIDLEKQLDNIGWLKKIKTGKITVYETYSHRDHFWLDRGGKISYKMVSPTRYLVEISTSASFNPLIFSENYSPYWSARIGEEYITSKKTKYGLNSFRFDKVGKYNVEVSYAQEKYFYYGRLVSFSTVIVLIILLIGIRRRFSFKN